MSRNAVQHIRTRYPGAIDLAPALLPTSVDNLWGWYPIDYLTGLSDGDAASALTDFSGNGNNGTTASAPTYKVNIVNGKPVLRYNGAHNHNFGTAYDWDVGTYFIVWSRVNATYNDYLLGTSNTIYSYLQYSNTWYYTNGGTATVAMAAGSFKLKCAKYDGTNVTLYTNGAQDSSPVSAANLKFQYLGAYTGFALKGDIAESIFYDRALSDADRILVESYVNSKYALW